MQSESDTSTSDDTAAGTAEMMQGEVSSEGSTAHVQDFPKSNMNNKDTKDGSEDNSYKPIMPEETTEAVDVLQQKLGGYGRYQILIYFLLGIVYMRGCWHALVPIYQSLDPGYHCRPTPGIPLDESVPHHKDSDGALVYDSCKQYVNFSLGNQTVDCTRGWEYDFDDSSMTSIVSEYTLTCDRNYLIELSTTIYMVGATCGVIFLSPVSERFGAKTVMLACLWLQAVVGTILPWSGTIIVFLLFKFFIGVFNMTIALCVAVMMPETFDAAHREIPVLGIQFFWAIGIMTLALFSYLLPDWKQLQLVITLPINVISIFYIWLIPQSLLWLISKRYFKKARRVIERFICVNKLPSIPNLDALLMSFDDKTKEPKGTAESSALSETQSTGHEDQTSSVESDETDRKLSTTTYTILHLLKTRKLSLYTVILCYLFLVNALAYFGIMYNTPLLAGNRYLNLFYSGLVEIPAYILCMITHKYIGRRRSISMFLLICAVTNIAIPFIPDTSADGTDLTDLKTALAFVGKFGITGSYSAIYLYASEIFPTVIRNQGVGFCSFFENIGSIAAPNMVYLNDQKANLALAIFGAMTIVGGVLVLFLPETHHRPLPQTIEDVEGQKKP